MKIKRLIPALAMLLVSAVLLGTSTFAWFSMNKTVTAVNMQIEATVPTQLLIKGSATNAEFKSSIDFTDSVDSAHDTTNQIANVVPVAYKGADESYSAKTISKFYKLTTDGYTLVKGNGYMQGFDHSNISTDTAVTSATFTTLKDTNNADLFEEATANATGTGAHNDYLSDIFTLKLTGTPSETAANNQLNIKITMETPDVADKAMSDIYQAVHVVLTSTSSQTGFTAALYDFDMGSGTATAASGSATIDKVEKTGTLDTFTAQNQEIVYNLYIFYDGEDAQCTNVNAVNMGAYKFTLEFSLPSA